MTTVFRAHFDGKVFVPDEPVDLPVNQPLTLQISSPRYLSELPSMEERQKAFEELVKNPVRGANVPDEALRRENLYEDR